MGFMIEFEVSLLIVLAIAQRLPSLKQHQQKRFLRLIRRRCIRTQGPDILRPVGPVCPD